MTEIEDLVAKFRGLERMDRDLAVGLTPVPNPDGSRSIRCYVRDQTDIELAISGLRDGNRLALSVAIWAADEVAQREVIELPHDASLPETGYGAIHLILCAEHRGSAPTADDLLRLYNNIPTTPPAGHAGNL